MSDIQVAIRKHALGEEVRLLVQRGSEPASEIVVRHVSGYPETQWVRFWPSVRHITLPGRLE